MSEIIKLDASRGNLRIANFLTENSGKTIMRIIKAPMGWSVNFVSRSEKKSQ